MGERCVGGEESCQRDNAGNKRQKRLKPFLELQNNKGFGLCVTPS